MSWENIMYNFWNRTGNSKWHIGFQKKNKKMLFIVNKYFYY